MKKLGFLVPILFVLMFTLITPRILNSQLNPGTMAMLAAGLFVLMMVFKPKKASTKTAQAVAEDLLDDFCSNAFADDEALDKKFQSLLHDIGANMPKSAVNKAGKLEVLCETDAQKYAVAVVCAQAWRNQQKYKEAVREYNKAIVLHPTAGLAANIGDCQQRLGNLSKAKDSYEFACELEPKNPKYLSSLATVHVADGDYETALDIAMDALELDETLSQALATAAICYGLLNDPVMHKQYTQLAVSNGYSEKKIQETVKALKER